MTQEKINRKLAALNLFLKLENPQNIQIWMLKLKFKTIFNFDMPLN